MKLLQKSIGSLLVGLGLTGLVFRFNSHVSHSPLIAVLLTLVLGYLVWTLTLLITWGYWARHPHTLTTRRPAAPPISFAHHQHHPQHFPGGSHRAS
ncbi:MAG: hypothetical protein C7B44_02280 [Sulfobacillus thermosulfidooxidans]|uniref:hypothetical protein n=1 Tax=Sulfobacillus TaxID=28033 RepID=UPI000CD18970|nr:hypothetical protein [Sulfobacillus sp. hq2]POB10083.1 hypothetical protein CO251_11885 [Sulfobacillus sp. hq2]PSR37715.1 MAG: hypothetical protein C7B44_02280 [Sulfobacillus thermosulfidooxidans]